MRSLALILGFLLALTSPVEGLADMYPDASNAKLPQARLNLGVATYDPVKDHGAPTDGTTDAAAQINASLADCQAAAGGRVILPPRQYAVIATDLTVPAGCSLEMASPPQMQQFNGVRSGPGGIGVNLTQPAIRLDPARTIKNHGRVRSLAIFQRGLTYPTSGQDTYNQIAGFAGTAITNSTDDTTIDDVFIIGFNTCIRTDGFQRPIITHLRLHCKNGLYFNHVHDLASVHDVHGWAYFPGNDPNGYAGQYLSVTGVANNGSGLIRLTLNTTAPLATGNPVGVRLVGGFAGANGDWTATVVDGTHIDLQGSVYSGPSTTGTFLLGETFVATASLVGIWPGQGVTGAGIPPGTTVRTIDPHKPGLWLSQAATAAGTGTALTFTNGAYTSGGQALFDNVHHLLETFISITNSEEMRFTDTFQFGWRIGAYVGANSAWATFLGFGCDNALEHMPSKICMYWDASARMANWVGGQGGGNSYLVVDKATAGVNSITGVHVREPFGAPFIVASMQGSAESQLANMFSSCGLPGCASQVGGIAIYTGAGRKHIGGIMPNTDVYPQNYNDALNNMLIAPGTTLAAASPFNGTRFTWSPTLLISGGASAGATYAAQQALGEKRWPWVETDFTMVLSNKGAGVGTVAVGGFPYSCNAFPSGAGLAMAAVDPAAGLTGAPMFEQFNDTPTINVRQTAAAGLGYVTDANLLNNSIIRGRFRCPLQWVQR